MKPKFAHKVDMSKHYVRADDTDVRATFARVSGAAEPQVCVTMDDVTVIRDRLAGDSGTDDPVSYIFTRQMLSAVIRECATRDEIDAKRYRALRKAAIDTNEKGFTSEAEIDQYVDEFVREEGGVK